jgi:hypothetical protein
MPLRNMMSFVPNWPSGVKLFGQQRKTGYYHPTTAQSYPVIFVRESDVERTPEGSPSFREPRLSGPVRFDLILRCRFRPADWSRQVAYLA